MFTELFIHMSLIWTEGPFIQEISGIYTSLILCTDKVKNGFAGLESFRGFWEVRPPTPMWKKNQLQNNTCICSDNAFIHCFYCFEMPYSTVSWKRTLQYGKGLFKMYIFVWYVYDQ